MARKTSCAAPEATKPDLANAGSPQTRTYSDVLVDTVSLRRAALCLIHVGAPTVVGTILGDRRAALIGAVIGLLLYFADDAGPLRSRFSVLALSVAGLLAGATAGSFLKGWPTAFWITFAIFAFAAGWSFRLGMPRAMAARNAAVALAVAGTVPTVVPHETLYAAAAVAVAALARLADHLMFGPLPQLRPPARPAPPTHGGWIRFAAAYAAAAVAGLWVGMTIDPARALWVVVASLFVMQPDAAASYVRVVERIVGTFVGVVVAYMIAKIAGTPALLCVAVLVIAPFVPHHIAERYWLHTALIAIMLLLANDLAEFGSETVHALFAERLQDTLLGCGLALVATAAAFPHGHRPDRVAPQR